MGWVRLVEGADDAHEGFLAYLFADGLTGATSRGTEVAATMDVLGRQLDDLVWRDGSAVIGWVPMCSCGWRDAPLVRVDDHLDASPRRRRYVTDEYSEPLDWMGRAVDVDELIRPAWSAHVDFVLAQLVTTH